jgi:glucose/arabinose dehydrogenase
LFLTSLSRCLALCTVAVCVPVFAQQNPPSKGRKIPELYTEKCASCHGADMEGGSASSLADSQWKYGGDDASVARSIRDGHVDAGMPAMREQLNGPEIRGMLIYIREKAAAYERDHTKYNSPTPGLRVQSEKEAFKLESVMDEGLDTPWAVAFLPDGRMLVTERPGRLRIIQNGRLLPEPVRGTPAVYGGEGGLLDVAIHPNYSKPGQDWIYLSYGDKTRGGLAMTAVIRGHLRDGAFVDQQQIFKADPANYRVGGQRFGSRLLFDKKGHLFFSIGDRAAPGDEQDLSCPNGKLHRVNDDGSVPKDNPFAHRPGALPTIWSYGHRNPQGLSFDPVTGDLWQSEHGPRGGDELNIVHEGHNYGWPLTTYGMNYDGTPITDHTTLEGTDQPVTTWLPSIAASPITFYTGSRFPEWKNSLFVGALAGQELRRLEISGRSVTHQEILFKGIGRVRDVIDAPDGYLYVVLNEPNRIVRLVPAGHESVNAISSVVK